MTSVLKLIIYDYIPMNLVAAINRGSPQWFMGRPLWLVYLLSISSFTWGEWIDLWYGTMDFASIIGRCWQVTPGTLVNGNTFCDKDSQNLDAVTLSVVIAFYNITWCYMQHCKNWMGLLPRSIHHILSHALYRAYCECMLLPFIITYWLVGAKENVIAA